MSNSLSPQVVNKDDDNWWQAVKVHRESESERPRQAGLIPSLVLQERRRAFINQDMVCNEMNKYYYMELIIIY